LGFYEYNQRGAADLFYLFFMPEKKQAYRQGVSAPVEPKFKFL
jgi:hypothetical protein